MSAKIKNDVKARYSRDAAKYRPRTPYLRNFVAAFVVGGLICAAGQGLHEVFVRQGLDDVEAGARMAMVVIVIGAILTGIGIYDRLAKLGGAGASVPIMGFSNSITASAMEFARDGYVLGMSAQIFVISGPVIVAGTVSAVLFTLIRHLIVGAGG